MSTPADLTKLVPHYFETFKKGDRACFEAMLADGFTFTSPYDGHIDRAAYFERCWPNHEQIREFRIVGLASDGTRAFAQYDCVVADGSSFRNTEVLTFTNGKLAAVEVYFGDPPSGIARADYGKFIENGRKTWKK